MSDHDRDLQRRIRERAYALWQAAGSPSGQDQEFWHRALELEAPHGGPHGDHAANGGEPAQGDAGGAAERAQGDGNGAESAHGDSAEASADPEQEAAGEVAAQTAEPPAPWWRRLF